MNPFWLTFFLELAANVIAGLIVLVAAYFFVRHYRKPLLRVEAILRWENDSSVEFEVRLRNTKSTNTDKSDINWHIFIDDQLQIEKWVQEPEIGRHEISGKTMKRYFGTLSKSLYPNRPYGLLRFVVKKPASGSLRLHYFLSTAYGPYPTYLRWLNGGEKKQQNFPCFATVTASGLAGSENKPSVLTLSRWRLFGG